MAKAGRKSWGVSLGNEGIQKHSYILGKLESNVHTQSRTDDQERLNKTLLFHLWSVSRLDANRKRRLRQSYKYPDGVLMCSSRVCQRAEEVFFLPFSFHNI